MTQVQGASAPTPAVSGSQELIPVFEGQIGCVPMLVCDARELHTFLEVGRDFTTWIKGRTEEYRFVEDEDFAIATAPPIRGAGNRGARTDYHLTLDTAKELAMVENNDQGRAARRYFIECERRTLDSAATPLHNPDSTPLLTRGQVGQIVRVINQRATALHGSANEIGRKLLSRCEALTYDDISAWRFDATMKWLKSLTHADVATDHTTMEERMAGGGLGGVAGVGGDWRLPSGRPGEKWVVAFDAEGKPTIAPYRPPRAMPDLVAFKMGQDCIGNFHGTQELAGKVEHALERHPDLRPDILVTAFRLYADEENLPGVGLLAERLADFLGALEKQEMNRRGRK